MNRRTGPQSDDMGETHAGAFDLPRPGVAAQMQAQLIEIGDTRGTDRMPLRQETSRDVDRYTPAERSSPAVDHVIGLAGAAKLRSEEPTSELQSLMRTSYAVFCLKKKIHTTTKTT